MRIMREKVNGTRFLIYSAWKPNGAPGYGTIQRFSDSTFWGRVGTERYTYEMSQMFAPERRIKYLLFQNTRYEEAYAAIIAKVPGAISGVKSKGQITISNEWPASL